jgi:hypothetical protein
MIVRGGQRTASSAASSAALAAPSSSSWPGIRTAAVQWQQF